MSKSRQFPTKRVLFFLITVNMLLCPMFSSAQPGVTVGLPPTTVVGPGITTSVSPANAANNIIGTPIPHVGEGTITTFPGPATIQANSTAKATGAAVQGTATTFQLSGSCTTGSATFTITNTGVDMIAPYNWTLDLNGTPVAANPFQINAGQSFNISTSGLFGSLTLNVLDASNTVVATASTDCATPPPPVPPSFNVSASCSADGNGVMTITDVGGNMTTPFTWSLDLNGTPVAANPFQINAGQSFNISTSGLFGSLTLNVLDASNTVVATASTDCATPPPPVPPSFNVSASCSADGNGVMTITDVGGNMTTPFTWSLDLNGTPVAANPFQINAGQSFNISTSGLFGSLTLNVLDASNTVVATASTDCATPPPPVPPSFNVSASCAADGTGVMTITDVGGNMTTPFTWILDRNGAPISRRHFLINAGQSTNINTSGLFGTLTLNVLDTSNTVVATGTKFCPAPHKKSKHSHDR